MLYRFERPTYRPSCPGCRRVARPSYRSHRDQVAADNQRHTGLVHRVWRDQLTVRQIHRSMFPRGQCFQGLMLPRRDQVTVSKCRKNKELRTSIAGEPPMRASGSAARPAAGYGTASRRLRRRTAGRPDRPHRRPVGCGGSSAGSRESGGIPGRIVGASCPRR